MGPNQTETSAPSTLQARMRYARELAEVEPAEMDRLAGFGWRGHYALIEAGVHRRPTGESLAKIGRALGVSIDWLVSGTGRGPNRETVLRAVQNARAAAIKAKKAPPPEAA